MKRPSIRSKIFKESIWCSHNIDKVYEWLSNNGERRGKGKAIFERFLSGENAIDIAKSIGKSRQYACQEIGVFIRQIYYFYNS